MITSQGHLVTVIKSILFFTAPLGPLEIEVLDKTRTSAQLFWGPAQDVNNVNYLVLVDLTQDNTDSPRIQNTVDNTATVVGLTAGELYTVRVQADPGNEEGIGQFRTGNFDNL